MAIVVREGPALEGARQTRPRNTFFKAACHTGAHLIVQALPALLRVRPHPPVSTVMPVSCCRCLYSTDPPCGACVFVRDLLDNDVAVAVTFAVAVG